MGDCLEHGEFSSTMQAIAGEAGCPRCRGSAAWDIRYWCTDHELTHTARELIEDHLAAAPSTPEPGMRLHFPHSDDCAMWNEDPPRCTCAAPSTPEPITHARWCRATVGWDDAGSGPSCNCAPSTPEPGIDVKRDRLANILHDIGGEFCHPFTEYHPIAMHRSQASAIYARLASKDRTPPAEKEQT